MLDAGRSFDVIVIGSGPAGQHAAIEAARHGRRTLVVERQQVMGGVCVHTGTLPSKAFREAVLALTGWRSRCMFPDRDCGPVETVSMADIKGHIDIVTARELRVIEGQLKRHGVEVCYGTAQFFGPHALRVTPCEGEPLDLHAGSFVIAVGTSAFRPPGIEFDDRSVIDSDQLYHAAGLPKEIVIIGGGVIAIEYASVFAMLGTRVWVVNRGPGVLGFVDRDVTAVLLSHLGALGVDVLNNETVSCVRADGGARPVAELASGRRIAADMVMVASGRVGTACDLDPGKAGLSVAERGLLSVNPRYQTEVPHIYAAGDVIGPPATASNAKEQGRLAARSMLGLPGTAGTPSWLPMGIFTIPEIGYVGMTQRELETRGIPHVCGVARFGEVARGEIIGDTTGLMKLAFHRDTRALLGVHVVGTGAAELVQTGHAAITFGATIDYFLDSVFNYPTLSECYKIAAYDAEAKLTAAR